MVDQLPTNDTFDTLQSTWLSYKNNIIAQTNGTHTLKIQGFDPQNQDLAIAISDISFSPALTGVIISPPTTNNLLQNADFSYPQLGNNSFIYGNTMAKSGISLSYWSIPALGIVQLINGTVSGTYLYNSPGVGVQYFSMFGVNGYASQTFYASTTGTYRLTFNYASALGSTYNIGNPLKISITGIL